MKVDLGNINLETTVEEIQRKRTESDEAHKKLLKDKDYVKWTILVPCAIALFIRWRY